MNAEFFKSRQKSMGVTVHDIGEALGRDRTVVSRMYSGRQRMTLDDAATFAEILQLPIDKVIEEAGIAPKRQSQVQTQSKFMGFSDSDAVPIDYKQRDARSGVNFGPGDTTTGIDVWQVRTRSLMMVGFLPDDFLLIDSNRAGFAKSGDVVIARVFDYRNGSAKTILRRYEKPVLVAASPDTEDWGVHVVDEKNVAIKGVVTASWREF